MTINSDRDISRARADRITKLLEQELGATQLHDDFPPVELLEAADVLEIDVPHELRSEVERFAARRVAHHEVRPASKCPTDAAKATTTKDSDDENVLSTRERNTLLKILIGMAMAKYKYDPRAARTNTVTKIVNDMEALGMSVDGDTVRKYLREAAEFAPDPDFLTE